MANTYTQLYVQFVFAVRNRASLIDETFEQRLYQYMTGIIQNHQHKVIAINGMPDHIHIFAGIHPNQSISDIMKTVKGESSGWVNERGLVKGNFKWQEGFGAFSYSRSHIDNVYKYILNQKKHHRKRTFIQEYVEFLDKFGIEYDERYVFKEIE